MISSIGWCWHRRLSKHNVVHMIVRVAAVVILIPSFLMAQARIENETPLRLVSSSTETAESGNRAVERAPRSSRAAYQQLVTLSIQDSTIGYVLRRVAELSKQQILFDESYPQFHKRIRIRINKASGLNAVIQTIKGTGLTARIAPDGETIMVRPLSDTTKVNDSTSPRGRITGRVTDSASGRTIQGVTVTIPSAHLTAVTDDRGMFNFLNIAPGEYRVVFKLLGYRSVTRTVTVEGRQSASMRVALHESASLLSEVVTSVTGTQRKLEVGNDIAVINVDSVMRVAPISSMTDLLETRVPGLTVMRSSGVPGAPARLRLRGLGGGLLSGEEGAPTNDPIVIVDGIRINASQSGISDQNLAARPSLTSSGERTYSADFPKPSPIDQIDPNSVEKVEVLKGPSASALYGSDAANGVIIITTKRGKGGPVQWSMAVNSGIEYFPGTYTAPGYYPFCRLPLNGLPNGPQICSASQMFSPDFVIDSVARFQALNEKRLIPFSTGIDNGVSASMSGGSESLNYAVTGTLSNQLGVIKVPDFYQDLFKTLYDSAMPKSVRRPNVHQTRSINASFATMPRSGFQLRFVVGVASSANRQSSAQLQLASLASSYIDTFSIAPNSLNNFVTQVRADQLTINNTLAVAWNVWASLPLSANIGFSRASETDSRFVPRGFDPYEGVTIRPRQGFYSLGKGESLVRSVNLNGTLLPSRRVSTAGGIQLTYNSRQSFQAQADSLAIGITVPSVFNYSNQSQSNTATGGWFLEPRLNLNSRFFVNPGFRLDGSNLSGSRSGVAGGFWSFFPKLNFSWVAIDRNEGTPLFGVVSMLRPRLSFGVAGVPPAVGWHSRLMTPWVASCGPDCTTPMPDYGVLLSTLGNTKLHPERTREVEGGFDIDLWGGRVSLTLTQFYKLRIDAIEKLTVASSIYGGSLPQYRNIGQVRNTGTEIALNATVIENPIIRWAMNTRLSTFSNRLLSLNSEQPYLSLGNGARLVPGYPLFGIWARPILGATSSSKIPGRLSDRNDVVIADSAIYIGQQLPNFDLAFDQSLSLFHGMVSLNATFQYKDGLTQFNSGSSQQVINLYLNPRATIAQQAAALVSCGGSNVIDCTNYGLIQTVSSLRLSSFSVGYTVPRHYLQRFGVPSVVVSLQGTNLGLWTNYRGKDPDVNGVSIGDATQDNGQLPQQRTWRLQVRVGN